MKARILVVDGSPAAGQDALVLAGGARSGKNYAAALHARAPEGSELDCFILAAADGERLPQGMQLADFQGIAFTGSPLAAYETSTAVMEQIELARAVFQSGVPCFGSCWGLQVMTVALGGKVHLNPKGYEVGIARQIRVNDAGRAHGMFAGKPAVFDAVCTHQDEVSALPPGAILLAGNAYSNVQASAIEDDEHSFWGVQYHPEFRLGQVAAIMRRRAARLVNDGYAISEADVERLSDDFASLQDDPGRRDVAWRYGIGPDVSDDSIHQRELANWVEQRVLPRANA